MLLPVSDNDSQKSFRRGTALFKYYLRYFHGHTACRRRFSSLSRLLFAVEVLHLVRLPAFAWQRRATKFLLGNPGVSHQGNTWIHSCMGGARCQLRHTVWKFMFQSRRSLATATTQVRLFGGVEERTGRSLISMVPGLGTPQAYTRLS